MPSVKYDGTTIEVAMSVYQGTGGATTLAGLTDTTISSPSDGQSLTYDNATSKWVNSTPAGGGDVLGPASSVDARIAIFNGTSGKTIQDGGSTVAAVLSRTNHTGTQTASTISDFDTEVSNNSSVVANTAKVSCITANVNAAGAVMESDFDANTILAATTDNTPITVTVAEQTLVGRITSGNITALTATQIRTLLNVADGAEANLVDSVNSQTGAVVLDAEDVLPSQTGNNGKFLTTNGTISSWATIGGGGDMLASIYDPLSKSADAFDMANMEEGTTNKIFSATERTNLGTALTHVTSTGADHTWIDQNLTSGQAPTFVGTNITAIPSANVNVQKIGTPTNDNLKEFINVFASAGCVSGFGITDNGDGTIDVAAGECLIRSTDADNGELFFAPVAGVTNQALTDNSENYIYVDYNAGSPIIDVATSGATIRDNENTLFEIVEVYRTGTDLHITEHCQQATNTMRKLQQFLYGRARIYRANAEGGLIISEVGTRNVAMTAGRIWIKLQEILIGVIDTSASDTFDRYYRDGVGGWTKQAAQTQWSNTQYDDGTGTLATIAVAKYSFQDFYIESDGGLVSLFGQAEYNSLSAAETASASYSLPGRLTDHAIYIGRIVFIQGGSSASSVLTAFNGASLNPAATVNHSNLSTLGWEESNHTGTASNLAGFNGSGAADHVAVSTGLSLAASALSVDVGIADNKIVQMDDADAVATDYAKFTANGLEGRSAAEVKTDLSLNNVENTALSIWAGTTNITTVGTVSTGTWQGIISNATLTLKQSTSPTNTGEGTVEWDTNDDLICIGDGTNTRKFNDTDILVIPFANQSDDMTAGTNKFEFQMPNYATTIVGVPWSTCSTAPTHTTTALTIDLNAGGTSVLSTKITFDSGEKTSLDATTPPVVSNSSLAAKAVMTIDIVSVGDTTAGKGGIFYLEVRRT